MWLREAALTALSDCVGHHQSLPDILGPGRHADNQSYCTFGLSLSASQASHDHCLATGNTACVHRPLSVVQYNSYISSQSGHVCMRPTWAICMQDDMDGGPLSRQTHAEKDGPSETSKPTLTAEALH
ncbi:hypothetical protein MN608_08034 [Microdochium nivale]|nr:hypothetical protein MN608_08034 [Microdochium nivale]